MKYVEKITPDFPSKSSKFLGPESCVYTLAIGMSCAVPVIGVRVRIWFRAGEEQETKLRALEGG